MSNLIKQRSSGDCGVACIAMFAGVTYEEAEKAVGLKRDLPVNGMRDEEIALNLKYNFGIEPALCCVLVHGAPAIISVPSLATMMKFHFVYWDGFKIYDPSKTIRYTTDDFVNDNMPLSSSIMMKDHVDKLDLPSHYKNDFDWSYLKRVYN